MIGWAAFLVVAADALIIRFVRVPWIAHYGLRFAVALVAILVLLKLGVRRRELGLSIADAKRDAKWTFWCATFFLGAWTALMLVGVLLVRHGILHFDPNAARDFRSWGEAWEYALSGLLLAPIVEETIYRGIVVPSLRDAFPRVAVIAASGAIFYCLHLAYGRPWWMLHYVAAGAILAWAFLSTGKLWVPIALHSLGNLLMAVDDVLLLAAPEWVHRVLTG